MKVAGPAEIVQAVKAGGVSRTLKNATVPSSQVSLGLATLRSASITLKSGPLRIQEMLRHLAQAVCLGRRDMVALVHTGRSLFRKD